MSAFFFACLLLLPVTSSAGAASFKALTGFTSPVTAGTWKIHDRDGANRRVTPYLSSLGQGEAGTGAVISPVFTISAGTITFTCCGHDGQKGEKKANYCALVDAKTGAILKRTFAPLSDPMQPRSWDVKSLKGRKVRFKAHDGDAGGAFAWLGVGSIQAGGTLTVDFKNGLPEGWEVTAPKRKDRMELLRNGVPFLRLASRYSLCPSQGSASVSCSFRAQRIFFLGATVCRAAPLERCGRIDITYEDGATETIALIVGFTLDREGKKASPAASLRLHASADPFQYYFVFEPKPKRIKQISIAAGGDPQKRPRITAVTCETTAEHKQLHPLPAGGLTEAENEWIVSHMLSGRSFQYDALRKVKQQIRKAHRLPPGAQEAASGLLFKREKISGASYEACSVFDVDRDGAKDIVSGAYWYKGSDFHTSYKITDVKRAGDYWDDFSDYPLDVNGDGFLDIVTGGFFGGPLRWLENPQGKTSEWTVHKIADAGAIETTRFWDVDGDGVVEVVPNAGGNVIFFRLVCDGRGKGKGRFTRHVVKEGGCGHGLGFGDITGDGRGDFIVPNGWLEAPADPLNGTWTFHAGEFALGTASVPILVHDVNEDGRADLIVGGAHSYGLYWYEQVVQTDGVRAWKKHLIEPDASQYHDVQLCDIDNDGRKELVTGKRYHAHNGHDPGAEDPLYLRYFDIDNGGFICHTIEWGPAGEASGAGIYFWIDDVDGNGWKDIVAPGKEGLFLFRNSGLGR